MLPNLKFSEPDPFMKYLGLKRITEVHLALSLSSLTHVQIAQDPALSKISEEIP